MKKAFILVILIAGVTLYGAFNYHVILTDDTVKLLPKASPSLTHTVVDARGANVHRLLTNPVLLKAGIKDAIR